MVAILITQGRDCEIFVLASPLGFLVSALPDAIRLLSAAKNHPMRLIDKKQRQA